MAEFRVPYQNISIQGQDEGQLFRGEPGNGENQVFMRQGNNVYYIPKERFKGNFNSLPVINPSNDFLYRAVQQTGGRYLPGNPKDFTGTVTNPGEVITKTISQSNPQGADIYSSTGRRLQSSPSTAEVAAKLVVTPEQLISQQVGNTNGDGNQGAISAVKDYLDKQYAQGNVINPNAQITPNTLTDFLTKAQNEIHPYFASQLKVAKDSFLTSLGYSRDEILRQEQQAQQKYANELRTIGESNAEKGFAQSGIRQREEQNLATNTQQSIDTARTRLGEIVGGHARTFAQEYGGAEIPQATIGQAPRVLSGEPNFQTSTIQNPLYQLSPDIYNNLIGNKQREEATGARELAQFYEGQTRTAQSTPTRYF